MLEAIYSHLRGQWMGALALFLVLGGGAVALGAVISGKGEIKACYDKAGANQGEVRLLVKGKCTRQEKAISWNQKGVAGPQGPAGSPDGGQAILGKLGSVDGPGSGLDADTLDGLNPASFMQGRGQVTVNRDVLTNGGPGNANFLAVPGLGRVEIGCGDPTSSSATFRNTSGASLDLWEMFDGGPPAYFSLANNGIRTPISAGGVDDPARIQWEVGQGDATSSEMATIIVDIFNAPNLAQTECHFQAMAVTTQAG